MAQFPVVRKEKTPQQGALIAHWPWLFFTYDCSAEGLPDIKEQVAQSSNEGVDEENCLDKARMTSAFKQYVRKLRLQHGVAAAADQAASATELRQGANAVAQAGACQGARAQANAIGQAAGKEQDGDVRMRGEETAV